MKHFTILAILLATPAFAQSAPTVDDVRTEANAIITAVRQQRDQNADALAQSMAMNSKLTKEIEALKAPKVEPKDITK